MIPRQIIYNLVEEATAPDLPVRFTGLVLADYSSITMHIIYEDRTKKSKTVTPDGTDAELGHVAWDAGDLPIGRHKAAFALVQVADSKTRKLPVKYPVILNVRQNLD